MRRGMVRQVEPHQLVGYLQPGGLYINRPGGRSRIPCSPWSSLAPPSCDLGLVTDCARGIQERSDEPNPARRQYVHRHAYRSPVVVRNHRPADSSSLGNSMGPFKARGNPIDCIVLPDTSMSCGCTLDCLNNIGNRHLNERPCLHNRRLRVHFILRQSCPRYHSYRDWRVCAI